MASLTQNVWLITGCSSILGYQLSIAVLSRGDLVIAAAASMQDLDRLHAAGACGVRMDDEMRAQKIKDRVCEAVAFYGRIDVIVNCPQAAPLDAFSSFWPSYHYNAFSFTTIQVTKTVAQESAIRQVVVVTYDGGSLDSSASNTGVIEDNIQATAQLLADEYRSRRVRVLLVKPSSVYAASGAFIPSNNTKLIAKRVVEKVVGGGSSEPGLQVI